MDTIIDGLVEKVVLRDRQIQRLQRRLGRKAWHLRQAQAALGEAPVGQDDLRIEKEHAKLLKQTLGMRENRVHDLERQLGGSDKACLAYKADLAKVRNERDNLQGRLEAAHQRAEAAEAECDGLKRHAELLKADCSDKKERISLLDEARKRLSERVDRQGNEIERLQGERNALRNELERVRDDLNRLRLMRTVPPAESVETGEAAGGSGGHPRGSSQA